MPPLVVVEGSDRAFSSAIEEMRRGHWTLVAGWRPPLQAGRVMCTGVVDSAEDAAAALLAVVAGAGVVIHGRAERGTLDRLCDDLRRFGRVDHRLGDAGAPPTLSDDQEALVALLLEGKTLGSAAKQLAMSRRTADRRLAEVRQAYGVATTAEALAMLARQRG